MVRKYPIPVINIPRNIEDQAVGAIAFPIAFDSALNSAPVMASETIPALQATTIIRNPASMKLFHSTFRVIINARGIVNNT